MQGQMAPALGGIFFILWLIMMIGVVAGWVIFLVAIWRGMKAHESVAESLQQIAQK